MWIYTIYSSKILVIFAFIQNNSLLSLIIVIKVVAYFYIFMSGFFWYELQKTFLNLLNYESSSLRVIIMSFEAFYQNALISLVNFQHFE